LFVKQEIKNFLKILKQKTSFFLFDTKISVSCYYLLSSHKILRIKFICTNNVYFFALYRSVNRKYYIHYNSLTFIILSLRKDGLQLTNNKKDFIGL
jgi:hypothetical protein